MKYMTADLVNRMNGEDQSEGCQNNLEEVWGKNGDLYMKWLKENLSTFPTAVQKFLDKICLHDAVIECQASLTTNHVCFVRLEDSYVGMAYTLECPVEKEKHTGPGFYEDSLIWLYDEFDIDENGKFIHNILLSDGTELHIKFRNFNWFKGKIEESY